MKIISFNVNGLRHIFKSLEYHDVFQNFVVCEDPDAIFLQETRCPRDVPLPKWFGDMFPFNGICAATKKGYSGVGYFSKTKPVCVVNELVDETDVSEGRSQLVDFGAFQIVNLYVPNSKPDLARLAFRAEIWEPAVIAAIQEVELPNCILIGDLNVVPCDVDAYKKLPKNMHCATPAEKGAFGNLCTSLGFVDAFRELHPTKREYSWFSNFANSREKNNGLRIDHVLCKPGFIRSITYRKDIIGSDHVPVVIEFDV